MYPRRTHIKRNPTSDVPHTRNDSPPTEPIPMCPFPGTHVQMYPPHGAPSDSNSHRRNLQRNLQPKLTVYGTLPMCPTHKTLLPNLIPTFPSHGTLNFSIKAVLSTHSQNSRQRNPDRFLLWCNTPTSAQRATLGFAITT
jgi:hypothetical protein